MKSLIYIVLFFLSAGALAQQTDADFQRLLYRHEYQIGGGIHTRGLTVSFEKYYSKDGYFKHGIQTEFASLKHPKEVKVYHPFYESARGYIFGKLNGFSTLRLGYGAQKMLVGKTDKGSVAIGLHYSGGYSNGFLKPVYLEVIREEPGTDDTYLATERYDPDEHNGGNIYGRASWLTGFNDITIQPGVFVKGGATFEYSVTEEEVALIETGIVIDYFPQQVPIMASEQNLNLFTTLYISIHFGKRWN